MKKDDDFTLELAGTVTKKWMEPGGAEYVPDDYFIRVSRTTFPVSKGLFNSVIARDEIVVTLDLIMGVVTKQQLSVLELQEAQRRAKAECVVLRDLEIDAKVEERGPLSAEPTEIEESYHSSERPSGQKWWQSSAGFYQQRMLDESADSWIRIAGGPIRFTRLTPDPDYHLHVPDSRIRPNLSNVAILSRCVRVKAFPLFGRVTGLRVRWDSCGSCNQDRDISLRIASSLRDNVGVAETIISGDFKIHVATDPSRGSWVLFESGRRTVTEPWWDCCQAIAGCLLATPMPNGE